VLPVIGDSKELFKAEFGHVTFGTNERVNVHKNIAAVDDAVHLMYRIQHHLTTVALSVRMFCNGGSIP